MRGFQLFFRRPGFLPTRFKRGKTFTQQGQRLSQGVVRASVRQSAIQFPFFLLQTDSGGKTFISFPHTHVMPDTRGFRLLCQPGQVFRLFRQPGVHGTDGAQQGQSAFTLLPGRVLVRKGGLKPCGSVVPGVIQSGQFRLLFPQGGVCGVFSLAQRGQGGVVGGQLKRAAGTGKAFAHGGEILLSCGMLLFFPADVGLCGMEFLILLKPVQGAAQGAFLAGQRVVPFRSRPEFGAQRGLFFRGQRAQSCQFRHESVTPGFFPVQALVGAPGNKAVQGGSGNLLQNGGALGGGGIEKGGEVSLRQQHGAGKAIKVQSGKFRDPCRRSGGSAFQDFAVFRVSGDIGYLMGIWLKGSARSAPCAMLIPCAAVTA